MTDVWFRSTRSLLQVATALQIAADHHEVEDTWEWVIGELCGVNLAITRDHTRRRRDTDVRVFRLDLGAFIPELKVLVVERLRPLSIDSIKCGRWISRRGNEFDMVVVEEFA